MKIRNGFISNSSSSSFVVLFPLNFDKNLIFDKIEENDEFVRICEYYDLSEKEIKEKIVKILNTGYAFNCDISSGASIEILKEIIPEKYIIAEFNVNSSDGGEIIILSSKQIKEILNEN